MKKLIILSFVFLLSCSVVPMTGRKQFVAIPSSQMIALSAETYLKQNNLQSAIDGYDWQYNPQTAPAFWERMAEKSTSRPPEFLSTHPDPSNRIVDLNRNMPKAMEYYNPR